MGTAENKAIVRRWFEEVLSGGNPAVADELGSLDYVWHYAGTDYPGLDALKERVAARHRAAPDMRLEIENLIAEGDKVACRTTASGTREGKRGWSSSVHIVRLSGGRVAEIWAESSGWKEVD